MTYTEGMNGEIMRVLKQANRRYADSKAAHVIGWTVVILAPISLAVMLWGFGYMAGVNAMTK